MSIVGKETYLGGEGHGSVDTVLVGQRVFVDGLKFLGDGEEGERGDLVLAALFVALRGRRVLVLSTLRNRESRIDSESAAVDVADQPDDAVDGVDADDGGVCAVVCGAGHEILDGFEVFGGEGVGVDGRR